MWISVKDIVEGDKYVADDQDGVLWEAATDAEYNPDGSIHVGVWLLSGGTGIREWSDPLQRIDIERSNPSATVL